MHGVMASRSGLTRSAVTQTSTGWIPIALLIAARAAVLWSLILQPTATRSVIARAAVLQPTAIPWPAIVGGIVLWAAVGGRDQGQRPEQQADEDLGAQQIHAPARTGGLHGLRHGTDPRPGGGRLRRGQAPSRQRGGAIVIPEERDPRPTLRLLAAP